MLWKSLTDTQGAPSEFERVPEFNICPTRDSMPLWSPVTMLPGEAHRAKRNVAQVHALVLDLDDEQQAHVDETLNRLMTDGLEYWAHTSYSHKGDAPRWRVVIPFASPAPGNIWRRIWGALVSRYAPWSDPKCCDSSRAYYVPCAPPDQEHEACKFEVPGKLLDWSVFPLADEPAESVPLGTNERELTPEQLGELVVAIGSGFPQKGERHELALALGGALRRELVSAAQIELAVFGGFAMGGSDRPEVHAATALHSAASAGRGDPTFGWTTVSRILGPDWGGKARTCSGAPRAGIDFDALQRPANDASADVGTPAWVMCLKRRGDGYANTAANVAAIVANALPGCFGFNIMAQRREVLADGGLGLPIGPYSDDHTTILVLWLSSKWGIECSTERLEHAVSNAARAHSFHPLQDRLRALKWDGVKRLDSAARRYLCAADETSQIFLARWMIAGVARAFKPGCKADTMLVLEGPQGILKSTALSVLALQNEWFSDTLPAVDSKDAMIALHGKWIIEIAELQAIRRAKEVSGIKAFLTTKVDAFRSPYARNTKDHARGCIFAGTTNDAQYLSDDSGARRFWPIRCTTIDINALRADVEQLWAEAVVRFDTDEQWYLTAAEEKLAAVAVEDRHEGDPLESKIAEFLATKPPGTQVTPAEILDELRLPCDRPSETRIGRLIKRAGIGWVRTRVTGKNGARLRVFQRANPVEALVNLI